MPELHNTTSVAARIRRIEQGVLLEPSAWAHAGQRAPLLARMAYYTTLGVSVAVINHGALEWARGYGVVETGRSVPVTPETIFQACSISKHVALIGALRLVQEGILDLDEDVNHYLTSWKLPPNGA